MVSKGRRTEKGRGIHTHTCVASLAPVSSLIQFRFEGSRVYKYTNGPANTLLITKDPTDD